MVRLYLASLALVALAFTLLASPAASAEAFFGPQDRANPYVVERAAGWRERTADMGPVDCEATGLAADYCRRVAALTPGSVKVLDRWIRRVSERAYRPDVGGDYWGTLVDMVETAQGDCDDLATLSYHALRGIGERATMAVLYHPTTRAAHMVTLWFVDDGAPRMLDPTGMIVDRTHRLNADGSYGPWIVLGHFDESGTYSMR